MQLVLDRACRLTECLLKTCLKISFHFGLNFATWEQFQRLTNPHRFFGSLQQNCSPASAHSSQAIAGTTEKLDLILEEVRGQQQSFQYVQNQCDEVLSVADTVMR